MKKNQIDSYTFDTRYLPRVQPTTLTDHEQQRIQKKPSQIYINSRYILRAILELYSDAAIFYHPSGKPDIDDPNISFSISHSDQYMTIAIMSCSSIGIDIQYQTAQNVSSLHQKYPHIPNNPSSFLKYWKTTEAYCKCTQNGLLSTLRHPIGSLISKDGLFIAYDDSDIGLTAISTEPIIKINHCAFMLKKTSQMIKFKVT